MNSDLIECVDQSRAMRHERNTLAVFELPKNIKEPFTLNIVPQWEEGLKNRFLVLDEIAYIGECATESTRGRPDHPDEETYPTRPPHQPSPVVTIPVETSTTPPELPTTSIRRMLTTEPRWTTTAERETTTEREATTIEEEETSSTSEEATELTEEPTTTEEETEEPETTTTAVKKVTVGSTRRPPAQTRRPIVVTIYPVTPNKQTSKKIHTKKRPWTWDS